LDDPLDQQKDYIRTGYINIGGTKFKLNLPMYDLNQLGGVQKTLKTVIGSANPFIQSVFELGTNKEVLTGAPIKKELNRRFNPESDYDMKTLSEYLGGKFGGYPAWVVKDIYKNVVADKGKLTIGEEIKRVLQSYLVATPSKETKVK
jgi:hypothetical protein